jgi:tRNA A-37 threonylcarbamoyl transferase component Bud32
MSAICPSCHHKLNVTAAKPGRSTQQCPECQQLLLVTVARDGSISAVADNAPAEERLDPERTMAEDEAEVLDAPADPNSPRQVGNYEIIKRIGEGGMGAVYLARQKSLDRLVAVKIIHPRWARDPRFLVRFMREAYAAGQLAHHNVVQVYDFGTDDDTIWFSMEYVDGITLGKLLATKGRLDAPTAAGYILQAARGLEYAHRRGMVHRDIKPDNLMLNQEGIIKVADLGLVLAPSSDDAKGATALDRSELGGSLNTGGTLGTLAGVTLMHQTMGTPAFMAPEQIKSASSVDERADIYSLGCTLYLLITGRPVFKARTVQEMMQKQLSDPIARPETYVKNMPKALSASLMKMLAKDPADRYQTTGALIRALERCLGVGADSRARIAQEQADALARAVRAYHTVPAAHYRPLVLAGGVVLCGIAVVLALMVGAWKTAFAFLGLAVMTPLAYFVVNGALTRSYLFMHVRQTVLGSGAVDWLKAVACLVLFLLVLACSGLLFTWLVVCALAVAIAFALHFLLDRLIAQRRQGAVAAMEKVVRGLRVRGISEAAIRKFVCQYAGESWEEPFEELFGYEAKVAARAKWGAGPKGPRPRHAGWRDPVVRWIAARQRARQEAHERRELQVVEERGLVAAGMTQDDARQQAEAVAEAMVEKASEIKESAIVDDALVEAVELADAPVPQMKTPDLVEPEPAAAEPDLELVEEIEALPPPPRPPAPRVDVRQLQAVAAKPPRPRRPSSVLPELRDHLFGAGGRLGIGGLLVAVGVAGVFLSKVADELRMVPLSEPGAWRNVLALLVEPRSLFGVVTAKPMTFVAAAVAGILLMLSSFQPLRWRTLLHYACAVVMIAGPLLGVPAIESIDAAVVSLVVGGVPSFVLLLQASLRPPE